MPDEDLTQISLGKFRVGITGLKAAIALSLPSMIVIARVMGWKKTAVFVSIIVLISTFVGMGFGWLVS